VSTLQLVLAVNVNQWCTTSFDPRATLRGLSFLKSLQATPMQNDNIVNDGEKKTAISFTKFSGVFTPEI